MKPLTLLFAFALGLLGLSLPLRSQVAPTPTSVQQLQKMKEQNQKIIEQQEAALLKLDEIQKNAEQVRVFSHRT